MVLVVPSELATDGTGDAPRSLSEEDMTETSEATSSPSPRPPTRLPGASQLPEKPGKSKVKGKSPKLDAELSLEGDDTPRTSNASYMGTTMRENQRSKTRRLTCKPP